MVAQLTGLGLFVAVFAIAARRNLHLGISMLPVACAVGIWLAGMPLDDVLQGFPVGIVVLLAGVTYFFGIAHVNGTIDALMAAVVARVGGRAVTLPVLFFLMTAVVSAMGSPLAGLVTAPIGMPLAKRFGIDPMLMALAIATGLSAGAFAPTSLFGIVTYGVAQGAGVDLNAFVLFAVACAANVALFIVAFASFGGPALARRHREKRVAAVAGTAFTPRQKLTLVCMCGLVAVVVISSAMPQRCSRLRC